MSPKNLYLKLAEKHSIYKEKSLTHRRFKHRHLCELIEKVPFEKKVAGLSFEEREIYQISLGKGTKTALLWSQMHGDEATATMAMMDIFHFFQAKNDEFDAFRATILENMTLHFVPMLNPDGAERFQRRTATDIDMNRDALALQTPEGRLLVALQYELKPDFSFNLHDKNTRYSAGISPFQATISFLATAFNSAKEWNENRHRAMQVIVEMKQVLEELIPNRLGRWTDDFEPRAFGDVIQRWGSSLILIESGGYLDDTEKQFIRKLNFVAILTALYAITTDSYQNNSLSEYEALPQNERALFDVLIRGAVVVENNQEIRKDIGINCIEKNTENATRFVISSVIEDMGDLSTFWGIQEIDAQGMVIESFEKYPTLREKYGVENTEIVFEGSANFLLTQNNGLKYGIVNGAVIEL